MLVLKWLKINCLMLYSQKNKCLVLSKYPHSDPHRSQPSISFGPLSAFGKRTVSYLPAYIDCDNIWFLKIFIYVNWP